MHTISFEKSQRRVVQSHRVSTPDDHKSLVQVEEWVIVSHVHKHPTTLADATRVYAEATSSSVHFLIAENERMAKELKKAKKRRRVGESVCLSWTEEGNTRWSIVIVMRALYSKFGTCIRYSSISMDGNRDVLEEHVSCQTCMLLLITCKHGRWDTREPPLHFPKMIKAKAVKLKARIRCQI